MESPRAMLFAPGLDPGGLPVRATLVGRTLRLEGEGARMQVPCAGMTLRTGGFDGRQWLLEWRGDGGVAALLLPVGPDADRLLAALPEPLAGQLVRHRRRDRAAGRRFRLGLGIAGLVLLLPFLLLAGFWFNADRVAGWATDRVSQEQERQLGDLAFARMRPGLRLLETGPAPALVREIGGRLTAGSGYRYRWFVADDPRVNAFALPGGYVVVHTGLIRAAGGAEEVAGVLAHEVQHVELRHSLRNLIHGLGWRVVLALALGEVSGTVWGGVAERLGAMHYSRELESQADLAALDALRRAGIAPDGMVGFFARLAGMDGVAIPLLSSHPAGAARLAALSRAIAARGAYPATPLPYDWAAIQASLPAG